MIGLIFATGMEAGPLLAEAEAVCFENRPIALYKFLPEASNTECLVAISGMGGVSAALSTQSLICIHKVERIIHAGICGALVQNESIKIGEVFRVTEAREALRKKKVFSLDREWWNALKGASMVTSERPVFEKDTRKRLSALGDLVDMESAVIARVAKMYDVPCSIVKGVTDFADRDGKEMVKKTIGPVSEKVSKIVLQELGKKLGKKPE